ncbi:unnamed protein product [marine sediment metagenome]|uniref:Uncharacterized protein n=1 Tax=marine sediment metagenome TaxID=412755 RepID=X1D5Y1_9ZZZZ
MDVLAKSLVRIINKYEFCEDASMKNDAAFNIIPLKNPKTPKREIKKEHKEIVLSVSSFM